MKPRCDGIGHEGEISGGKIINTLAAAVQRGMPVFVGEPWLAWVAAVNPPSGPLVAICVPIPHIYVIGLGALGEVHKYIHTYILCSSRWAAVGTVPYMWSLEPCCAQAPEV